MAYKTNAFFFYIIFFSLSMFVRFPCQNFMSLLVDQQNTIKYLFKTNLLRLVSSTSPLNIGVLQLQKVSHQFIAWILILCSCVIWDYFCSRNNQIICKCFLKIPQTPENFPVALSLTLTFLSDLT